uniref:Putative extracellular protein TR9_096 n=1 Tax=Trebouxia lynnae TaxID=1825957 RepID=A0A7L9QET0_9CHLO|nr:putative extracellular protein TR9_096 [Trebouxia lynnae]
MSCTRSVIAIYLFLVICTLTQPAHSATDRSRSRSLRGFSNSAEVSSASAGRKLTQSGDLARGLYNIQSQGRLGSCWSYLSIPNCTVGDTVDLYSQDDGSGRQQWELVPVAGNNLYYLLDNGRTGCTSWLSGQPCPENRIAAWYTDDSSGRQQWQLSPLGNNIYTISLPQGRSTCETYLQASTCGVNSAVGSGLTEFTGSDTGSGFEHWLITPVSGSAPASPESPPQSSAESSPAASEFTAFAQPSSGSSSSPPPPGESLPPSSAPMTESSPPAQASAAAVSTSGASCGKKGVVYDFFFQYGPAVQVTNSDYWLNFDAGFDGSITDPAIIAKHQPMVWGTDRIESAFGAISSLATKPQYLLTFNEPNYAFGGGTPSNVVDPVTAAGLWPQLMSTFGPLGIQFVAPSAIDCAGDGNCHNVGTAAGWLSQFRDTLNANTPGAWDAIHALSYHTYAQDLGSIVSGATSLYQQFGKPIWITEIAAGGGASMQSNVDLMNAFLPWANSQPWIERYFWNQATPAEGNDANIQNSYLVNKSVDGSGDGSLSILGQTYANDSC